MLKRRIIPIQLISNGRLVKSIKFKDFRDVGDPVKSSAIYNSQNADELILLNVSRENNSCQTLIEILKKISEVCYMPLAVGGGINKFSDAALLIESGADKVVINSSAYNNLELINLVAKHYGNQAVVVGVDVKFCANEYQLLSQNATKIEAIGLNEHLKLCEAEGAGEFLIQSIDQDGVMNGYDIELLKLACSTVKSPIIGCGGSGNYNHLKEAFLETDVSALACGSLFNFSDSNPMRAKAFLSNYDFHFKVI